MLFFKYVLFYPLITLAWNWEGSDTAHSAMLFVSVSDGKQICAGATLQWTEQRRDRPQPVVTSRSRGDTRLVKNIIFTNKILYV